MVNPGMTRNEKIVHYLNAIIASIIIIIFDFAGLCLRLLKAHHMPDELSIKVLTIGSLVLAITCILIVIDKKLIIMIGDRKRYRLMNILLPIIFIICVVEIIIAGYIQFGLRNRKITFRYELQKYCVSNIDVTTKSGWKQHNKRIRKCYLLLGECEVLDKRIWKECFNQEFDEEFKVLETKKK